MPDPFAERFNVVAILKEAGRTPRPASPVGQCPLPTPLGEPVTGKPADDQLVPTYIRLRARQKAELDANAKRLGLDAAQLLRMIVDEGMARVVGRIEGAPSGDAAPE